MASFGVGEERVSGWTDCHQATTNGDEQTEGRLRRLPKLLMPLLVFDQLASSFKTGLHTFSLENTPDLLIQPLNSIQLIQTAGKNPSDPKR